MTSVAITIRPAVIDDADAISRITLQALRQTNAADYTAQVIAAVAANFSPAAVAARMASRRVLVAVAQTGVIGTASLDGATVRSVFVQPDRHGQGAGAALMAAIEHLARAGGLSRLVVPSSVTAEGFYATLGFVALRDEYHGVERTIVMEKRLLPPA
ncbi:GNAT family acetyltransferase [Tistrella bauzanensis]|uniref:GNAT family acetyltransferase n=1 Tax=Tistrella bauzanensis TaxID=657419 RepID=A0ABQ1J6B7_9PROT|nr:GNAT family N-acetyltransferase [Tistrella bauzanensis]GGB61119.1 GNAT family acetyltransferase [Tistrella bauzanensis]